MRLEKKRNYYEGNGEGGTGNGVDGKVQKALADKRMEDGLKVAPGGGRAGARPSRMGSRRLCGGRNKLRPSRKDNFRKLGAVDATI